MWCFLVKESCIIFSVKTFKAEWRVVERCFSGDKNKDLNVNKKNFGGCENLLASHFCFLREINICLITGSKFSEYFWCWYFGGNLVVKICFLRICNFEEDVSRSKLGCLGVLCFSWANIWSWDVCRKWWQKFLLWNSESWACYWLIL